MRDVPFLSSLFSRSVTPLCFTIERAPLDLLFVLSLCGPTLFRCSLCSVKMQER